MKARIFQNFSRAVFAMLATLVLFGSVLVGADVATAASAPMASVPPQTNVFAVGQPHVVSDGASKGEKVFYPLPDSAKDAIIVTPDVTTSLGISATGYLSGTQKAKVLNLVEQSKTSSAHLPQPGLVQPALVGRTTVFWAPSCCSYGPIYQGPVAMAISQGGKYYAWEMNYGSITSACGMGRGFYTGYNGGSFGLWTMWYQLGCRGSGHVPWDGNVLAYPQFRATSTTVWSGSGYWV